MQKVDFIELALFCVNRYKESHNINSNSYAGTLYVAIVEDNKVLCSRTPHILKNAEKCILVHQRSELAVSNYYLWYNVEFIDESGCVHDGNLGDGFNLKVSAWGQFSNQVMSLSYNQSSLYWFHAPFENKIPKMWELYTRLKEVSSSKEIELISDLFRKDEQVLTLEKEIEDFKFSNNLLKQERDQYKELLDEIKEITNK